MATYDNAHSRLVAWLKILLPLAALGLLSTLFLFSHTISPEDALPYAEVDVNELAREQRLTGPRYSGVTSDGAALSVTARTARPDPSNPTRSTATELVAHLETPDGVRTDLSADAGEIDTGGNRLSLSGSVRVTTSSGLKMSTEALNATLDSTMVESPGPVTTEAPMGTITSGNMRLTKDENAYVVVFNGGVKLIYQPRQ